MALALSEFEELQQAVESTDPKELFLKVLNVLNDEGKRKVLDYLGVDVKKCNPIYMHKHFKYVRKEHGENIFMFVDKEYQIMAFLVGTSREETEHLEAWYHVNSVSNQSIRQEYIVKNKKNLWENAYHILMFDKSEIKKIAINNFDPQPREMNVLQKERNQLVEQMKRDLPVRVINYKLKKYSIMFKIECENDLFINKLVGEMIEKISKMIVDEYGKEDSRERVDSYLENCNLIFTNADYRFSDKLKTLTDLIYRILSLSDKIVDKFETITKSTSWASRLERDKEMFGEYSKYFVQLYKLIVGKLPN